MTIPSRLCTHLQNTLLDNSKLRITECIVSSTIDYQQPMVKSYVKKVFYLQYTQDQCIDLYTQSRFLSRYRSNRSDSSGDTLENSSPHSSLVMDSLRKGKYFFIDETYVCINACAYVYLPEAAHQSTYRTHLKIFQSMLNKFKPD